MKIFLLIGILAYVVHGNIEIKVVQKICMSGDCDDDQEDDDVEATIPASSLKEAEAALARVEKDIAQLEDSLSKAEQSASAVQNAGSAAKDLVSNAQGGKSKRHRRQTNSNVTLTSCDDHSSTIQGTPLQVTLLVVQGILDELKNIVTTLNAKKLNCFIALANDLSGKFKKGSIANVGDATTLLNLATQVSSAVNTSTASIELKTTELKASLQAKKTEMASLQQQIQNLGGPVVVTTPGAPTTPSPECPPGGATILPSMTNATFVCSTSVGETTSTSSSENVLSSAATTESTRASCPGQTLFGEKCWSPGSATQRIVGGTAAEADEYPYQVFLEIDDIACGGSILSSKWILTAAHCLYSHITLKRAQNITIYANTIKRYNGIEVQPSRLIIHPGYECTAVYNDLVNDIALLELCEPLDLNLPGIKPICFLKEDTNYTGPVTATGWGYMKEGSNKGSDTLQEVVLDLISEEQCIEKQGDQVNPLNGSYVCTLTTGKDTCQGDSGGPLVGQVPPGCWVQLGIVSYSIGCARDGVPGIYMKVSFYRDWICEVTKLCG